MAATQFTYAGSPWLATVNRPGFPGQVGATESGTARTYKTIQVGAFDDNYQTDGKERKANYSNMGNAVDCWAAAEGQLTACDNMTDSGSIYGDPLGTRYNRYDAYYTINSVQSVESEDRLFDGTSCACPVAAGIIATKLQYQRSWTWSDVKTWIQGLGQVSSSEFHYGSEGTTATDSSFTDMYGLQGNPGYVLWDKETVSGGTQAVITLNISADSLTEGTEKFRIRIREGSINGPIVGTSEDITISDTSTGTGGGGGGGDFGADFDAVRFASGDGLVFNGAGMKIYVSPS